MTLMRARGRRWITMKKFANGSALFVGHDGEVKIDTIDSIESHNCVSDAILDFVAQRTTGNSQGDLNSHDWTVDGYSANHPEVDDAPVEFGVLNRTEDLDDIGIGDGHLGGLASGQGISPTALGRIPRWNRRPSVRPSSAR